MTEFTSESDLRHRTAAAERAALFEKLLLAIGRFGRRRRTMDPRKIEIRALVWRAPSVVKGKQRKPSHFDSASLRSKKIALTVTSHINLIL